MQNNAKMIARYQVSMNNVVDVAQLWRHGADDYEIALENGDCSERGTFEQIANVLTQYRFIKELEVQ